MFKRYALLSRKTSKTGANSKSKVFSCRFHHTLLQPATQDRLTFMSSGMPKDKAAHLLLLLLAVFFGIGGLTLLRGLTLIHICRLQLIKTSKLILVPIAGPVPHRVAASVSAGASAQVHTSVCPNTSVCKIVHLSARHGVQQPTAQATGDIVVVRPCKERSPPSNRVLTGWLKAHGQAVMAIYGARGCSCCHRSNCRHCESWLSRGSRSQLKATLKPLGSQLCCLASCQP